MIFTEQLKSWCHTNKLNQQLPLIVLGAACLFLLFSLVQTSGLFVTKNKALSKPVSQSVPVAFTLPDIAAWHLFGTYQTKAIPKHLPKTNLQLSLIGIFMAKPLKNSHVVIAVQGESEKSYALGDTIPGGAKIQQILPAGVVLEHNGRLEKLLLPKKAIQFAKASAPINFEDYR